MSSNSTQSCLKISFQDKWYSIQMKTIPHTNTHRHTYTHTHTDTQTHRQTQRRVQNLTSRREFHHECVCIWELKTVNITHIFISSLHIPFIIKSFCPSVRPYSTPFVLPRGSSDDVRNICMIFVENVEMLLK